MRLEHILQAKFLSGLFEVGAFLQLSHEKRAPFGWLGYLGDEIFLPSYIGDYFINHEISGSRIPINQPGFPMESKGPRVFFVAQFVPDPGSKRTDIQTELRS